MFEQCISLLCLCILCTKFIRISNFQFKKMCLMLNCHYCNLPMLSVENLKNALTVGSDRIRVYLHYDVLE